MAEFITTDDGGWSFKLDGTEVPELPVHDPFEQQGPVVASYLEKPEKWKNYSDEVLFEVESLFRKFMETKLTDKKWCGSGAYWRKYTVGMMFEQLYGHKLDMKNKDDAVRTRRLQKIMTYYSSRIQKEGSIRGKKVTKKIYTLSIHRYKNKLPYCLKIRISWLAERGETPTWQNMKLPKDNLKAGHARNPKTDENMRIRRERAKQKYNERYKDRNH